MDRAAVVIRRRREIVELENHHLAVCNSDVAVCSEATDAIVSRRARDGVVEIEKPGLASLSIRTLRITVGSVAALVAVR